MAVDEPVVAVAGIGAGNTGGQPHDCEDRNEDYKAEQHGYHLLPKSPSSLTEESIPAGDAAANDSQAWLGKVRDI